MLTQQSHPLSIEEIEEIAASFKEDLQRQANQGIRKQSPDGQLQSWGALASMEAIDGFLYTLKLRAGSQMGQPARARPIRIFRKKE